MIQKSPSVLIDCNDHNAENPLWHPQHQYLYWTDIPAGKMYRYFLRFAILTNRSMMAKPWGGFTIQADGGLLLLKTKGTVEIWLREGEESVRLFLKFPKLKILVLTMRSPILKGRVFSGIMGTDENEGQTLSDRPRRFVSRGGRGSFIA